ncbi:MAG: hypothetical protein GY772_21625 [bacterium]|nr:hypothetical protein [bacterium]
MAEELDSLTRRGGEGRLASGQWLRPSGSVTGVVNLSLLQQAPQARELAPWVLPSDAPACFECAWREGLVRCHYCHAWRCSWHRRQQTVSMDELGRALGGGMAWCSDDRCNERGHHVSQLFDVLTRVRR